MPGSSLPATLTPTETLASAMAPLWPFILVAASGILAIDTPHPRNSALYHLTKQLLQKYHKEVRPVHDWTEATTVHLDVSLRAVLDVDVQNQKLKTNVWYREVWDDEFLSWNSSMFDDIREISLPLSAIWAPDIIINEFVDIERLPDLPYVYVNSSGTIKNSKSIQVVSACSLETYAFPFDIQNCSLTFNSILHTVEDVDLAFLRSREDIKHDKKAFLNDSEWELLSVSSTYNILQSSAGDFAQIQFHVVIRRRPLIYVVSLLIPSIFLMLVDLGSFYIPPTCHARIVFKTSVLVGYTVFRVNMSDDIPQSAVSTPLIGVFFTVCMAFLVLSLSKSILLVKFLHNEQCSGQKQPLLCLQGDTNADGFRMDPRAQLVGVTESPVCQEHQAQSGTLNEVLSQLHSISSYFQTQDQMDRQEVGWLALLERFDRLLFQGYLVVLVLYTITLCSLWALWSGL
ncbi:5-hydroxytryptamine receptor 3B [Phyllostomus hastatus]|uniref:5-hydroxytryptamine receptor 3B n=1 Tax=Phyllostomus hastatus TaxID=9423 RepID=UPI001E682DCB|nr:5-hydroxytryptamine receptor 3B [Phyllostomus hastatus]